MTALHYHPRRTPAEAEVEAAVASAFERCRLMEARVDALEQRIVAVRREAAAVYREPIALATPERPRRQQRLAARTALARAALR